MAEVPIGDVGRCISIPSAGGYDKLRIRGIGCPVRGFNVEEDTPVVTIRVTAFGKSLRALVPFHANAILLLGCRGQLRRCVHSLGNLQKR